jgi:hypothetical protein
VVHLARAVHEGISAHLTIGFQTPFVMKNTYKSQVAHQESYKVAPFYVTVKKVDLVVTGFVDYGAFQVVTVAHATVTREGLLVTAMVVRHCVTKAAQSRATSARVVNSRVAVT